MRQTGKASSTDSQRESSFYRSESGWELHRVEFEPSREPVGGVMIVHGLGDHVARYFGIGEELASRGLHAVAVDFPGHGISPGVRGHIADWGAVETVFRESLTLLRRRVGPQLPLGSFAHSMGAFLVLRFLEEEPDALSFAWLSSSLVRPSVRRGAFVRMVARVAARLLPRLTLDSGLRRELCQADLDESVDEDPLIHHRISVGWGVALMELEREVLARVPDLNTGLKVLMTHGEDDTICLPGHARELFEALALEDKEFVLVPGALHEPYHNNPGSDVLKAVWKWLDRLGYPAGRETP